MKCFRASFTRNALVASIGLALACAANAQDVQPSQDPPEATTAQNGRQTAVARQKTKQREKQATTLSTVVVTGSRILGRTVKNSSQPVDVLTPVALHATGAVNLSDALQSALPTINVPQGSFGDVGAFERPFELRGLSPDDTLVLVNGKRWHRGAFLIADPVFGQGSQPFNMNTIPMAAIDHVEVLRNGASSIYGSAAIAGVINVILKKGAQGNTLGATVGRYTAGDGNSALLSGSFGIPLGQRGWVRLSAEMSNQAATNRAGLDQRPGFTKLGRRFVLGIPQYRSKNIFLNMQYDFDPAVQFYAFGHFSRRVATPHVWSWYGVNSPAPFPTPELAAASPYPDGSTLVEHGRAYDHSLVAGLRGNASGWHWNVSANAGGNRVSYDTGAVNFALIADTGTSPTNFHIGVFRARQQAFDVDITKSFDVGWSHPLNLAFGAQWLRVSYSTSPGDPASYYVSTAHPAVPGGSFAFPGLRPDFAFSSARHDLAEYAQLGTNFTDKFNVSVSGRHSHYSDFGNNTSYALTSRYAFTPEFALRGTVSTGFRAPTLPQEHFSHVNFLGLGADNAFGLPVGIYGVGLVPPTQAQAALLGGKPLRAETSHNYTVGIVWTPSDSFMATLDVYKIRVKHQIMLSDSIPVGLPAIQAYLAAHGVAARNFISMQYFMNAGTLTTKGVDLVLDYQQALGAGTLFSSLAASYHRNTFSNIAQAPAILAQFGVSGFFVDSQITKGLLSDSTPRVKFVLNERYDWGHWEVAGRLTKYGIYTGYAPGHSAPPQTFSSEYIADLSASYFLGNWAFTVGGNNIFDNYPDQVIPAFDWRGDPPGTWKYSTLSPFGFSGARYYLRATLTW